MAKITNLNNSSASTSKISKISNWVESCMNPLAGMTKNAIDQMLMQKRNGNDARLQAAYSEIESNMPIFGIVIDKRTAGILKRKWDIIAIDDSPEAKKQADEAKRMLLEASNKNKDGFTALLQHLVLGAFRGRSVAKAFIEDGKLLFKLIDNWNVLEWNGNLYWNPDADFSALPKDGDLVQIPDDEVIWTSYKRPIDQPGIMIYLRQLVGEEQWSRFVEKEGIPQVILTPPEGTSDAEQESWMYKAMRIFEGGSGVLPPGATVDQLTAARGQDPFSEFVKHQMEMISILATGGTLATIGGSTGLGSNLADVQKSDFNDLVSRDCLLIQNSINQSLIKLLSKQIFKADAKCYFKFVEDDDTTIEQYLNYAKLCKDLGLAIDFNKLKELTNLTFIADDQAAAAQVIWQPNDTDKTSE